MTVVGKGLGFEGWLFALRWKVRGPHPTYDGASSGFGCFNPSQNCAAVFKSLLFSITALFQPHLIDLGKILVQHKSCTIDTIGNL